MAGWGVGAQQLELFIQLLDELLASDDTPEEQKGKLRQIRDGVTGLTRDVAVGLMTLLIARASDLSGGG